MCEVRRGEVINTISLNPREEKERERKIGGRRDLQLVEAYRIFIVDFLFISVVIVLFRLHHHHYHIQSPRALAITNTITQDPRSEKQYNATQSNRINPTPQSPPWPLPAVLHASNPPALRLLLFVFPPR